MSKSTNSLLSSSRWSRRHWSRVPFVLLLVGLFGVQPSGCVTEGGVSSTQENLWSSGGTQLWPNGIVPVCFDPVDDTGVVPATEQYLKTDPAYESWVRFAMTALQDYENAPDVAIDFQLPPNPADLALDFTTVECPSDPTALLDFVKVVIVSSSDLDVRHASVGYSATEQKAIILGTNGGFIPIAAWNDNVLHRMGHVLGFNHEYWRSDARKKDANTCGTIDAVELGEVLYTEYDTDSIMNEGYCNRAIQGLSALDLAGLAIAYPRCAADADCDPNAYCDTATGTCNQDLANGGACLTDSMCVSSNCVSNTCVCQIDSECSASQYCQDGCFNKKANGGTCARHEMCNSGFCAQDGTCRKPCSTDGNCSSAEYCGDGCRTDLAEYSYGCTRNAMCATNYCLDTTDRCVYPEVCDGKDNDLDGACDEVGCRTAVDRWHTGFVLYDSMLAADANPAIFTTYGGDYSKERDNDFYIYTSNVAGTVPLYQCFKRWSTIFNAATSYDHFYTKNVSECINANYAVEGIIGYVAYTTDSRVTCGTGITRLYRFYNPDKKDHRYQLSPSGPSGYNLESEVIYVWNRP